MSQLGIKIRERRKEADLKALELADKAGVKPEFITEIEMGRSFPSPKVLEKICLTLKFDFRPIYFKERHPDMYALINNKAIIVEAKSKIQKK